MKEVAKRVDPPKRLSANGMTVYDGIGPSAQIQTAAFSLGEDRSDMLVYAQLCAWTLGISLEDACQYVLDVVMASDGQLMPYHESVAVPNEHLDPALHLSELRNRPLI